ncbi:MAG: TonB-dependent receptor [Polyangiaceae bacterium]
MTSRVGRPLVVALAMLVPAVASADDAATPEPPPPPPPPSAEDVSVVGTRIAKTAGSVHVVGRKQLERFEYDDPQAILAAIPGVYGRVEDGIGLRPNIGMRGVNPDRSKKITLMEDGVLFGPAPYSAPAAYYFPMMTRMTQVKVVKGPGAIVYGPQTIGGAIDLVTRPVPSGSGGSVDVSGGQFGYRKFHGTFGSGDEKLGFVGEALHVANDGFKRLPSGADTGSYRNEAMFKARYTLDPEAKVRNTFHAKFTFSNEASNETYVGLTDADFRADPYARYAATQLDRMHWTRTAVALSHVAEFSPRFTLSTTAYRNDLDRSWRKVNRFQGADVFDVTQNPNSARNAIYASLLRGEGRSSSPGETLLVGPNARTFVSQGVQSVARWDGSSGPLRHRVEYGVRLHYDRIERRHSEDGFVVDGGALLPAGTPTVVTAYNEASTHALAMHATDAVTWKRVTLTPGVRFEAIQSRYVERSTGAETGRILQAFVPGVGAYVGITDDVGVLAGVHKGFSPPTPGPSRTTPAEASVNYEGGVRVARGRSRIEVIGFVNDYSNLTDVCTLSSGCVEANLDRQFDAGRATIRGVEAFAEHEARLGKVRFPLSLSYTFTKANFDDAFTSEDPIFGAVAAGDEMPYVPQHQLGATAAVEIERASFALAATYVSKMREIAGSGPLDEALHTDEMFLLDASTSVRVVGPLSIYANLRNLTDTRAIVSRRPYGARPNAPRWFQVGAKVAF